MKPHNRKLLDLPLTPLEPTATTRSPPPGRPWTLAESPSAGPYQSSVVLAVLAVLIIALFLLGFFSICMRRFSEYPVSEFSRRRRRRGPHGTSYFQTSELPTWSNRRSGVDPETIRALPVYYHCGNEKYEMDCAICLSEFEEEEAMKVIPFCKHAFHPDCIDTWLSSHVTCPVCRATRLFDDVNSGACLVAKEERCDQSENESGGRSTVGEDDTCTEVRVVGSLGFCLRRNSSCSSIEERTKKLPRTSSF